MSVSANGQGPREKARTPKPKGADSPATPMPISQVPGSSSVAIVPTDPFPTDVIMEDSSKCLLDGKTASNMIDALGPGCSKRGRKPVSYTFEEPDVHNPTFIDMATRKMVVRI